ncbi:MAG: C40 family peptidase [Actinomycetota bacterium]|nr:C40 family peptidase [Actinomycetota bacterium]
MGAALLLIPSAATAAPHATPQTPPTAASVEQLLTSLAAKNTRLVEQYDHAQVDLVAKKSAAASAVKAAEVAQGAATDAGRLLAATATAQYESGSFSTTGALFSSDSGQGYLDQLAMLQAISTHTKQVVKDASTAAAQADAARQQAAVLVAAATATLASIAAQRAALQKQVDSYTTLFDSLTTAQQAAFNQQINPAVGQAQLTSLMTSLEAGLPKDAAAKAVAFALHEVGKPYVYGAAGPGSYDCSGLTMAAWASAGVSLPHSSEDQFNYGRAVPLSALQPGDLVFLYGPPPGHVTIYIGAGLMVSAPQTGENVSVVPLNAFNGSIVGARRLVG